jgi:hypothetical protein
MSKLTNRPDDVNSKKSKLTFYQLPVEIAESPHLSSTAKIIYAYFYTVAKLNNGFLTVKIQTIATRFKLSYPYTWELINELKKSGLLYIYRTGRGNKIEIPALTGNIFSDATDLFNSINQNTSDSSKSINQNTSDSSKSINQDKQKHNSESSKSINRIFKDKYINKQERKREAQLTNMIPVIVLDKYKSISPIEGNNEEALRYFENLLDLTSTDRKIILNATGIEKNILLDVWKEIKKSQYLQSMSLVWILDHIEKVLNGKYRTFDKSK